MFWFLHEYNPDSDRVAFDAAWQARSQGAVGEVHAFEPNDEGSPLVAVRGPGGSAVGRHTFEARAGHHLAPAELSDGRNIYEVLGEGFSLLALGMDTRSVSAFVDAAAALGVPLQVIEDTAQGQLQRYAAPLVLIRPDQFVAWVGSGPVLPDEALSTLQRAAGWSLI